MALWSVMKIKFHLIKKHNNLSFEGYGVLIKDKRALVHGFKRWTRLKQKRKIKM